MKNLVIPNNFLRSLRQPDVGAGVLIIGATLSALILANSSVSQQFLEIWQTPFIIGMGDWVLEKPVLFWINDGLLTLFFLQMGLEIRRELRGGSLTKPREATFPVMAAIGGMLIPVALFFALGPADGAISGWGIPIGTDIVFCLGLLSLFGKRVPVAVKVFLVTLVVVGDLGAILVIAFSYTDNLRWEYLLGTVGLLGVLRLLAYTGMRKPILFLLPGIVLWFLVLKSGVHATVAGVMLAIVIPAGSRIPRKFFLRKVNIQLHKLNRRHIWRSGQEPAFLLQDEWKILKEFHSAKADLVSPLEVIEKSLHNWSFFLILPLFALANAGIHFESDFLAVNGLVFQIAVAMLVGKFVGIFGMSWLSVKLGIAYKPSDITWRKLAGVAFLGGIGFTMAIFMSGLALSTEAMQNEAKAGIVVASAIAALMGSGLLLWPSVRNKSQAKKKPTLAITSSFPNRKAG